MKKRVLIGLSLATPLAVNALNLQGSQTFTDEINIPTTHSFETIEDNIIISGINITPASDTVFKKDVSINVYKDNLSDINNNFVISGIHGYQSSASTVPSSTIFEQDLNIKMKGEDVYAIHLADKNSTVIINGKANLSVDSRYSDDDETIFVTAGKLVFNGETHIDNNFDAIYLAGEGTNIIFNGDSYINGNIYSVDLGKLNLNSKAKINGNILAYDQGIAELYLKPGSKIIGAAYSNGFDTYVDDDEDDEYDFYYNLYTPGYISMDFSENSSWDITREDSYINLLSGQGNIRFTNDYSNNNYGKLFIETLKGASVFNLRTNVTQEHSDKIVISSSAEGTHTINLINNGSAQTTGNEKLTLVEIDDNATNTAEFKTNHDVELGGYQYSLNKDGKDYVLTAKPITSSAMASAGFLNANYLMNYVETQTLLKRLGDMRTSGKFGDVWLRGFTGKLDSFSGGKLSKFDMSYHGFQFGADKQLSENSPFVIGAFVGQTYGNPDYKNGDGSLRSFNTGIYATYLDNSGFYIDSVVKYDRQKNHFKVKDTANNRIQGTGHSNGLGLSMELGQKFKINDFYVEPQTQFSYSHQNGNSINASNGLKVKLGNYNSLIGRASALLGYEFNSDENSINIYAKTGIVREFDGDTYYKLNNHKESHSFKGNWWNNGVGINANFNQKHNIYLDLESSPGNKFDLLQVNGGYRYSF